MEQEEQIRKQKKKIKRYKLYLKIAIAIIFLTLLIGSYLFIKPQFDNYVLQKQIEAQEITIITIVEQIRNDGSIQLTIGDEIIILTEVINPNN